MQGFASYFKHLNRLYGRTSSIIHEMEKKRRFRGHILIAWSFLFFSVPARIVNISKNVSVNEGENVNLYCLAVGRPEPTVTWKDQKCKLPLHVCLSSDPEISCSQLHLYLPCLHIHPQPCLVFAFFSFPPSILKAYQHSPHVHVFIPHPCVIILKPSCLVRPHLKFMVPYFPYVPMFCPW